LQAGDRVAINGLVVTGRDAVHKYLHESRNCPVSLKDGCLYHCGPVVTQHAGAWEVRAAGPTTSMREELYMAELVKRFGIRVIVGKGGMGAATLAACKKHGCVYIQVVGGAACVTAQRITAVRGVHFLKEFGPAEAMWELEVANLEGVVTMDAAGGSLHEDVRASSATKLKGILQRRMRRSSTH
jgi:fumarate hydratase class I